MKYRELKPRNQDSLSSHFCNDFPNGILMPVVASLSLSPESAAWEAVVQVKF